MLGTKCGAFITRVPARVTRFNACLFAASLNVRTQDLYEKSPERHKVHSAPTEHCEYESRVASSRSLSDSSTVKVDIFDVPATIDTNAARYRNERFGMSSLS